MSKPEPKFELGDLVRYARPSFRDLLDNAATKQKLFIATNIIIERRLGSSRPGSKLWWYKINGHVKSWISEDNLTLLSSVKEATNEQT